MTAGWRVEITSPARRELRRLDPPVRERVLDARDRLVAVSVPTFGPKAKTISPPCPRT